MSAAPQPGRMKLKICLGSLSSFCASPDVLRAWEAEIMAGILDRLAAPVGAERVLEFYYGQACGHMSGRLRTCSRRRCSGWPSFNM